MQYRRLGRTGVKISTLSLGSWLTFGNSVDEDVTAASVSTAFDVGINCVDTADVYALGKSETLLGKALESYRRKSYVLATKVFWPTGEGENDRGLSRKHIFESIDESLDRLKTSYVDLYQCHRFDPEADLEETVRAMEDLTRAGKILYWGVSVWTGEQMREAMRIAKNIGGYGPITSQPQYNMFVREIEDDALPAAQKLGMGTIVWSPLAQGMLTGKYRQGQQPPKGSRAADEKSNQFLLKFMTAENYAIVEKLEGVAAEVGCSLAQLALAWCLHREGITSVIVGCTKPEQLLENVKASEIDLSPEVMTAIDNVLSSVTTNDLQAET